MDNRQESSLEAMWRQYSFPTEVPMAGSTAETNLRAKAKEYFDSLTNVDSDHQTTDKIMSELAIMIYGSSMLEADQKEDLANFAKDLSESKEEHLAEAA